jgi:hypothetical protein
MERPDSPLSCLIPLGLCQIQETARTSDEQSGSLGAGAPVCTMQVSRKKQNYCVSMSPGFWSLVYLLVLGAMRVGETGAGLGAVCSGRCRLANWPYVNDALCFRKTALNSAAGSANIHSFRAGLADGGMTADAHSPALRRAGAVGELPWHHCDFAPGTTGLDAGWTALTCNTATSRRSYTSQDNKVVPGFTAGGSRFEAHCLVGRMA